MASSRELQWLLTSAVTAAIATTSCISLAQSPAPGTSANPPAKAVQPVSITSPLAEVTPEVLGDSLMARQRYQAAIAAYKKASPDASVWNKMGIAYQMMFNLTDAVRCYEASLRINPKSSNVLNNIGTVYDAQKNYGTAERYYRKALKVDPKSALILKNLGTDLLAQRKYKKGWEVYKSALAIDPLIFDHNTRPRVENAASVEERGAMNYYMAKGCVRAGMPERAIEYLRMAINEGFTNPKKIVADTEFASLHGLPAFEELLAAQKMQ